VEDDVRKEAIQRHILGGESPKTIYKSLNRSKKWFFKWLKRYESGESDWYTGHSRAPITRPAETKARLKEQIITTRRRLEEAPYAQIGVSAVK
jgi:transposase